MKRPNKSTILQQVHALNINCVYFLTLLLYFLSYYFTKSVEILVLISFDVFLQSYRNAYNMSVHFLLVEGNY